MNFHKAFDRMQELKSKKLIDGPISLTYGDVEKRSRQIYDLFKTNGLGPGDRIGIATTDESETCSLILTCIRLGMPVALIDPGAKEAEASQIIGKLGLKALFLSPELKEKWNVRVPHLWIVKKQKSKLVSRLLGKKEVSGDVSDYPECLDRFAPSSFLPDPIESDHPALLLCTSGTTGLPKILQLSLANLHASATTTSNQLRFDSEMRVLNLLPITHYDGVISGLFTTFCNFGTLIRLGPFTVSLLPDIFDAVVKYEATHVLLTPSIIGLMLRLGEDLNETFQTDRFQFVISVAATLPPKVWSDFQKITGKKIVNVYGLSETGNNLFAGPDDDSYRIGSIGKPVDCKAAVVDEKGSRADGGETGELLLQAASITGGYLGEPILSTKMDGEDWFATGDLAYCDDDGVYWLVGRKKNIIIVGGRNVYPDEINNVLLSHSAVLEAATVGLPDEMWGERVISCVVCRSVVSSAELLIFAAEQLTDYKVPREIHILNELPKGRSGKVLLNELVRRLQDQSHSAGDAVLQNLEDQVMMLASESFRTPANELSLKTAPANCSKWDSVAHMDFVTNLETKFGIELLPREVIQITSLDAAIRIVRSRLTDLSKTL